MNTDRLKALTDGVLAIVLTILVLGFEVPEHDFDEEGLVAFLHGMRHELIAYVVSFGIVAAYWVQHASIAHFLARVDRRFAWLNLLYMLPLTLLPFLTDLRAEYNDVERVTILYASVNASCGLVLIGMWKYALRHDLATEGAAEVDRSMTRRLLLGVGINLAGAAVALVSVLLSSVVFLALPLAFMSHAAVDRQWRRKD